MIAPVKRSGSLLRILGLSFGLAVTVGNTIGGGILRTPGDVASLLPNPWLFVGIWVLGGLYALLGANALSELGTMMPRSGGQYVFARHAFGDYAGFLVGWVDWISSCAATAIISRVIGESVASLAGWRPEAAIPVAMSFVVVFTLLLMRGTRLGDLAQRVTTLAKAIALLALIVACFIFADRAVIPPPSATPGLQAATAFGAFLLALQAVIYTYDGWSGPIYFSEELDDPGRQIPRSMFYGLLSITAIYLLINVAFIYTLPVSALAGSPLAAATVAQSLFGGVGEQIVRIVVVISLPSAVSACLLMASRVIFSVGRDGLGSPIVTRVNQGGTPVVALAFSAVASLAFITTTAVTTIVAIAAFFYVASYTLSFLGVFVLRRREPDAPRPYRAVGHPWTTGLIFTGSLAFLTAAVIADQRNSVYALLIVFVSYPIFRLTRRPAIPLAPVDPYLSK
jgi:basic amino acid/polyamine antiporter, APA family